MVACGVWRTDMQHLRSCQCVAGGGEDKQSKFKSFFFFFLSLLLLLSFSYIAKEEEGVQWPIVGDYGGITIGDKRSWLVVDGQ